ncbi:hypothetical protein OESDEN_06141, partial [Oesophagostomum dentatum]
LYKSISSLQALTAQLSRQGKVVESADEQVSVSRLLSALSTSPKSVRECFSAAAIQELISASNTGNGCISCQLIGDFLRTCCRRSQQRLLVRSCARSTEFITSNVSFLKRVLADSEFPVL